MNKITPFKTSLYHIENVKHDVLDFVYDELENEDSRVVSNRGGWQSQLKYYDSCEWMKPVIDDITKYVEIIYAEHGIRQPVNLLSYWMNINPTYSYNTSHNHPHCYFSAVWYLKTPENSGHIAFERPDMYSDYIMADEFNDNNYGSWRIQPKEYDLIIFPAYLKHLVDINLSQEYRVSIAFNYK